MNTKGVEDGKYEFVTREVALTVGCPLCCVEAGQPCKYETGEEYGGIHLRRHAKAYHTKGVEDGMGFKRVPSGPVCAKAGLWPYPCSGRMELQKEGTMKGSFMCEEHAFQAKLLKPVEERTCKNCNEVRAMHTKRGYCLKTTNTEMFAPVPEKGVEDGKLEKATRDGFTQGVAWGIALIHNWNLGADQMLHESGLKLKDFVAAGVLDSDLKIIRKLVRQGGRK